MALTKITWADYTFNPWWGCSKVSPGCLNCYAETFAKRTGHAVWGKGSDRRFFGEKHWKEPLKWQRKAEKEGNRPRVFTASMADWLEDRPDLLLARADLLTLICRTPNLTWLLLTKRPENFRKVMMETIGVMHCDPLDVSDRVKNWLDGNPYQMPNIWIGTTIENQAMADWRMPFLLKIPARIRFASVEPMLGPVTFEPWMKHTRDHTDEGVSIHPLQWIICGGESGQKRREMNPQWAENLAIESEIPFFMKQDSNLFPEKQGRLPNWLFDRKEFPA